MEHKTLPIVDLKIADDGAGSFSGYASTFDNFDSVGEKPTRGAFLPHLSKFLEDGFVAIGHNWYSLPIATVSNAYEDDKGLYVVADFHTTQEAQAARKVMVERQARGKSIKLSIGYEVLKSSNVEGGRTLDEIKLYEFSFVNVPANPLADITAVKSRFGSDMGFDEHSKAMVSAVEGYIKRAEDRGEFRFKEGRTFSTANLQEMGEIADALASGADRLQALIAKGQPSTEKGMGETNALRAFAALLYSDLDELGVF